MTMQTPDEGSVNGTSAFRDWLRRHAWAEPMGPQIEPVRQKDALE